MIPGPKSAFGEVSSEQVVSGSSKGESQTVHFQLTCSNENGTRWPARWQIPNPQSNPQNAMSYATSANFGSPRGLVSCCKSYSRSAVTAEVASSSLVVPAILFKHLHPNVQQIRGC